MYNIAGSGWSLDICIGNINDSSYLKQEGLGCRLCWFYKEDREKVRNTRERKKQKRTSTIAKIHYQYGFCQRGTNAITSKVLINMHATLILIFVAIQFSGLYVFVFLTSWLALITHLPESSWSGKVAKTTHGYLPQYMSYISHPGLCARIKVFMITM